MTYEEFWKPLTQIYDAGEAKAITRLVAEVRCGLTLADLMAGKEMADVENTLQKLLKGEPVQYVLGVAEFGPHIFHVAPGVLIPRPETYELCQWIVSDLSPLRILDIGTGSGCIACTLAAEIKGAEVTAWDISEEALQIARENAKRTSVHVSFEQVDVLNAPSTLHLPPSTLNPQPSTLNLPPSTFHLIVSNPPYVCQRERTSMARHVLDYEPELALFVPDDDPLLFYRAIARYAKQALLPGGWLYFEINPIYARQTEEMLRQTGFTQTETRRDQFGRERFTKTTLL